MTELNLKGILPRVEAVLKLVEHTLIATWCKDDQIYDVNIKVDDDLVDDAYEAADQAGIEIKMV